MIPSLLKRITWKGNLSSHKNGKRRYAIRRLSRQIQHVYKAVIFRETGTHYTIDPAGGGGGGGGNQQK